MTKNKLVNIVSLIICTVIIVAGMAIGTVCHFLAGGFFNYGEEFSSYNSVVINYSTAEYPGDKKVEELKAICDEKLSAFNAYEYSIGEKTTGGEIVYKYSASTDVEALSDAVDAINAAIDSGDSGLSYAVLHEAKTFVGGSKAITFAAIALASAAGFQLIYFAIRYKLRCGISALVSLLAAVGVFVSLAAITRIPVGTSFIALVAIVGVLTMIASCVLFDRVRKNFKNDANAKAARSEVIATSAAQSKKINLVTVIALAVAVVVLAVFAVISSLGIATLAPYALALMGLISCAFATVLVMPAVHYGSDALCEKSNANAAKADVRPEAKTAENS